MLKTTTLRTAAALVVLLGLACVSPTARAQNSTVMGEVRFDGDTQLDRDSGVWIDGQYVGYVKELKGNKKVMLLPGKHQISVRQAGYQNFDRDIVVEPGETMTIQVNMKLIPGATTPDVTSELKVTARPKRAAVFLDGNYVGHASELGGKFHSLLVSPGKHTIKIELAGYRTFETEVNVLAGQKSEVKTELVRGSIVQAGADIKQPQ
ncbi:MAG TPA: PEGA domain-containing protein [Candidatus Methylomirabilis sp.]|nr:PEGA domain-containing protein [Candidatus Methylomirabilis sp.]